MASSQIEIAASPPFGCILRDHNQRDRFRESEENGSRLAFQKNINEFVRDLHSSTITAPSGLRKINARRSTSPENKRERVTSLAREPSLPRSAGNSPNVSGASSLVQMWEARLNRSHSFNQNMITSAGSSRTNSGLSTTECASSSIVAESKKPEMETDDQSAAEEVEAESQQSASESASERERVRVADIIRRLTKTSSGGEDQETTTTTIANINDQEQYRGSSPDAVNPATSSATSSPKTIQSGGQFTCNSSSRIKEHQQSSPGAITGDGRVAFPQMSSLPRLRGRQAIQDLLMQMERDRQTEISSLQDRKAVSKFAQKGRIQSMLRLKVLQRGLMSPQDHLAQPRTRAKGTSSSIAARRSRFDPEAETQATSKPSEEEFGSRGLNEEVPAAANNIPNNVPNSSRSPCQENTDISHGEAVKTSPDSTRPCKDSANKSKQDAAKGACEMLGSSSSATHRPVSTPISIPSATEDQQQQNVLPPLGISDTCEFMHEIGSLSSYVTWQDQSLQTNEGSCWDEDGSMMSADLENSQQHYEAENSYYDWFSDICRPRRYWEDRRRARYQEVFETTSEDTEIRQLLERKTVSNFLDSSFRLRMDQLMMTRLSQRANPADEDLTNQVTMRLFCRTGQSSQQEHEENFEQMDDEERNAIGSEYNDVNSYFEQNLVSPQLPLPLPSPMSSSTWSSFREPELSDESGSNRPLRSSFHYANTGTTPTPSTNPISLEMELIYDLKGHMEQLYQEMTELRKSIRCCMDMQAKLHLSFKREEHPAPRKKSANNGTLLKKGVCCICYEMPVDSLLYRCGHMCTCLKCAQELQWSSGRCPICRAHITDVVRAYTDT